LKVLEAIETRRSVRRYKTEPVDEKALETVLQAARWAPSWANTQCWRFVVVRDSDVKSKLADTMIAVSDRPNRGADAIRNAPVTIVACAEMGRSGYIYGGENAGKPATDKGDWCMFDVALAMQNLTLAAHSLGLGTVHLGAFDAGKVAEILGVPEGYCVVEVVPLGYPDGESRPVPRKELSEIVFYEKWA